MLKTSSGKIRRTATAAALHAGALDASIVRRAGRVVASSSVSPSTKANLSPVSHITQQPAQQNLWRPDRPSPALPALSVPDSSSSPRPPLQLAAVKRVIASILAEELKLDTDAVLALSESFTFDEEKTLDEFGLDSLSAMRVAGRLGVEFDLRVPLSPFMFLSEPTLDGMCQVVMRLYDVEPGAASAAEREREIGFGGGVGVGDGVGGGMGVLPCIVGLGCVVPGPGAPQPAIMEVMIGDMQLSAGKAALFRKVGQTCGIDRRYSVLPSMDAIYFDRKGQGNDECIEKRNAVFKAEAPKLAVEAARRALSDWGGDKALITHVVAVTCTGVIVPGLEFAVSGSTCAKGVHLALVHAGCSHGLGRAYVLRV